MLSSMRNGKRKSLKSAEISLPLVQISETDVRKTASDISSIRLSA